MIQVVYKFRKGTGGYSVPVCYATCIGNTSTSIKYTCRAFTQFSSTSILSIPPINTSTLLVVPVRTSTSTRVL